ncbi:hypothetical protein GCM10007049_14540 [Echinicola pacifica]|uniref:Antitoxin component YwqK of the YwqJK toxin-antitoxin module n=1 Tax=Echinicola pacifica TaxID=346377 RepID=A0A918PTM3_9BACT|nr:hypothetical protein [Echinicola pacifica]GGZ22806.1 hypothetical protein GCM10007049_14540 [Echinicola pacifica]
MELSKINYIALIVVAFTFIKSSCLGQGFGEISSSGSRLSDSSGVVNRSLVPVTAPLLLFDDEKRKNEKKDKKKKERKNIYYGEQTKTAYVRVEVQGRSEYQLFHYTTRNRIVNPYIRDLYWYDIKERTVRTSGYTPEAGYLLHGPYKKELNEVVVQEGMFYFGTKHDRWMTYDQNNILINKAKFEEGWPKDSKVTYYNQGEQEVEKVIPIEYDLKEGNFFHFYDNGKLGVMGEYHYGEKVGTWTWYWNTENGPLVRKREIQYQEEPFTKHFTPYIRAEWDEEGKLIYRDDR